jgi:hypothetical protein
MQSALQIAFKTSGQAGGRAGIIFSLAIRDLLFEIALSPRKILPLSSTAFNVTEQSVTGNTLPRTASTSLAETTARSKPPAMSDIAVKNKLPKECPASDPEDEKRY